MDCIGLICLGLVTTLPTTQIDLAPRMQVLLGNRLVFRAMTWLGMYGGATPKPVKLLSDDPYIARLYRTDCSVS